MRKLFISAAIVAGLIFGGGVSSFATDTEVKGNTYQSTVQKNEEGINEAYLGCLMFGNDIQKCSDQRWGTEQALYNNTKRPSNITVKDLKNATPPNTDQK